MTEKNLTELKAKVFDINLEIDKLVQERNQLFEQIAFQINRERKEKVSK